MTKEEKIEQLKELDKNIQTAMDFDIPYDNLVEQKRILENLPVTDDIIPNDAEEVKEDAPFCRVLLFIEVNKEDITGAIDDINHCGYTISGVYYPAEV